MNRLVRPVMFAFEPDVVHVFMLASFGAAGAVTLNTNYSKGICNLALNTVAFTGTNNTSVTIAAVSSFAGLYPGMTVTGTNVPASTTISSMNIGASTITLSQATTGVAASFVASGGQYAITFGSQFTPFKRLDSYNRLLMIKHIWDETGISGTAPAAPAMFLVQNNISNAALASLVVQFGTGAGSSFTAVAPGNGEQVRIGIELTRSSAI